MALWTAILGTTVIWIISSILSLFIGAVLFLFSESKVKWVQKVAEISINLSRGVPVQIMILGIGFAMLKWIPGGSPILVFPGTEKEFQLLVFGLTVALGISSGGHIAEIIGNSFHSLNPALIEQVTLLGLSTFATYLILFREVSREIIPLIGDRLVHHLHNTSYCAFFPIGDLFGFVHSKANVSFRVTEFLLIGGVVYASMSYLIWLLSKFFAEKIFND